MKKTPLIRLMASVALAISILVPSSLGASPALAGSDLSRPGAPADDDYRPSFVTQTDEPSPWGDCVWASASMFLDSWTRGKIRPERETLRKIAGQAEDEPSNMTDFARGARRMLGLDVRFSPNGGDPMTFKDLLYRLENGGSALVSGWYSDLPEYYTRWDRKFAAKGRTSSGHAMFVTDYQPSRGRVWLMDPLGRGKYKGEWLPVSALQSFVWINSRGLITVAATPAPKGGSTPVAPSIDRGPLSEVKLGAPTTAALAHPMDSAVLALPYAGGARPKAVQPKKAIVARVDWLLAPDLADLDVSPAGPSIPSDFLGAVEANSSETPGVDPDSLAAAAAPTTSEAPVIGALPDPGANPLVDPVAPTAIEPGVSPDPGSSPDTSPNAQNPDPQAATDKGAAALAVAEVKPVFSSTSPATLSTDGVTLSVALPTFAGRYLMRVTLEPATPGEASKDWVMPKIPDSILDVWGMQSADYGLASDTLSGMVGMGTTVEIAVRNTGWVSWAPEISTNGSPARATRLVGTWIDEDGIESPAGQVAIDVAPSDTNAIALGITMPRTSGDYRLRLDVVDDKTGSFAAMGSPTAELRVGVVDEVPTDSSLGISATPDGSTVEVGVTPAP